MKHYLYFSLTNKKKDFLYLVYSTLLSIIIVNKFYENNSNMLIPFVIWIICSVHLTIAIDEVTSFEKANSVSNYVVLLKGILYTPIRGVTYVFMKTLSMSIFNYVIFITIMMIVYQENSVMLNSLTLNIELVIKTLLLLNPIIIIAFILFQIIENKFIRNFARVILNFSFMFGIVSYNSNTFYYILFVSICILVLMLTLYIKIYLKRFYFK